MTYVGIIISELLIKEEKGSKIRIELNHSMESNIFEWNCLNRVCKNYVALKTFSPIDML